MDDNGQGDYGGDYGMDQHDQGKGMNHDDHGGDVYGDHDGMGGDQDDMGGDHDGMGGDHDGMMGVDHGGMYDDGGMDDHDGMGMHDQGDENGYHEGMGDEHDGGMDGDHQPDHGPLFHPYELYKELHTAQQAGYTDILQLLQRIARSHPDVSRDGDLIEAMHVLNQIAHDFQTPDTGGWQDEQLQEEIHKAESKHQLRNTILFLSRLHTEGIEFSSDEQLQQAIESIGEVVQGYHGQ